VRDFSRAAEIIVAAVDTLIMMSGSAGFASSNPIQRAWRDIHFAATHVGLNVEPNYTHYSRMELGLPSDGRHPFL
jgi:alkylation response protein AidB-like acyl-CoA dehydrogenase